MKLALKLALVCLVLLAALSSLPARAQTPGEVTIAFQDGASPSDSYAGTRDARIVEINAASKFGTDSQLDLYGDDFALQSRLERRSLLAWDIRAIPPGSRVLSAQVILNVAYPSADPFSLYPLYKAWNETEATWLRRDAGLFWESAGANGSEDHGPGAATYTAVTSGLKTIALNAAGVEAVQQWVNQPERNFGFLLAFNNQITLDSLVLSSRESSAPANHPRLSVTYLPPEDANSAPAAESAGPLAAAEDAALVINPTGSDPDGDPLVYRVVSGPANGTLALAGSQLVYRPALNYTGADSFTFAVSDGRLESAPAEISLDVTPANDAPTALIQASPASGSAPLSVTFSAQAADVEDSPLTYRWDFAGLGSAEGAQACFTFTQPGVYPVTLAVSDGQLEQSVTTAVTVQPAGGPQGARNVIVFVGDGMGTEHSRAAGLNRFGRKGMYLFEHFPYHGLVNTTNASGGVTDSAAAGTALATGRRVENKVISWDTAAAAPLYTALEYARDRGKRTGLVTNSHVTDATPASFGAHEADRTQYEAIGLDLLDDSRPNVLFGAKENGASAGLAQSKGYTVVESRSALFALPAPLPNVAGLFTDPLLPYLEAMPFEAAWPAGADVPHLWEMTAAALQQLENPDGFFLLVENENTDRSAHIFDLAKSNEEVTALERSVRAAVDWARSRPNTLIVVLADHETGGLVIDADRGQGQPPAAHWTAPEHTAAKVQAYALGPGGELLTSADHLTDIFGLAVGGSLTNQAPAVSAGTDQTINWPQNSVSLSGSALDTDGPYALTYAWSQVSGPGTVSFASPASAVTSATFSAAGVYTLRLSAYDGILGGRDELIVTLLDDTLATSTPTHTSTSTATATATRTATATATHTATATATRTATATATRTATRTVSPTATRTATATATRTATHTATATRTATATATRTATATTTHTATATSTAAYAASPTVTDPATSTVTAEQPPLLTYNVWLPLVLR